jgi:hypothetical protein
MFKSSITMVPKSRTMMPLDSKKESLKGFVHPPQDILATREACQTQIARSTNVLHLIRLRIIYGQFTQDISEKGKNLGANRLQPVRTATTVRVRDGKRVVTARSFRRNKGAIGRLLSRRRQGSQRSHLSGRGHSGRSSRFGRGSARFRLRAGRPVLRSAHRSARRFPPR